MCDKNGNYIYSWHNVYLNKNNFIGCSTSWLRDLTKAYFGVDAGFIMTLFLFMNYFEHNKHLESIKVLIQYVF